jgi:hypothetical protein
VAARAEKAARILRRQELNTRDSEQLRGNLRELGLETKGKKSELIGRLLSVDFTRELEPPLADMPPAGGHALLERSLPDLPADGDAGYLKLTVLESATCSTTSGATSPTASADTGGHDAASMDGTEGLPAEDTNAPRPQRESARGNALQLHRAASGDTCFHGRLAPYSIVRGRVEDRLLAWLQEDPTFPRSRAELERRYNFHLASSGASSEKRNNEARVQVMGHTVDRPPGKCNGLDASQPMPQRLVAFVRAFRKINEGTLSELHQRLQTALAKYSDEELKADGMKLRDVHPADWIFNYGMIQVMKPGRREDWKHIDGGASLLHLGLGLCGKRTVKHWEKCSDAPHEIEETQGSAYISTPCVNDHQVAHRDAPGDVEGLMFFDGMGWCKVAIQLRCDLCSHYRGRISTPIWARHVAAVVMQPFLTQVRLLLPGLNDCERAM